MRIGLGTSVLLVALSATALAEDGSEDASQGSDRVVLEAPLDAQLGDPIDVILEVTTAESDDVAIPEQSFGPFEVFDKSVHVAVDPNGTTRTFRFELRLLCFELGTHTLGPLEIRVTTPNGELRYLKTDVRTIEVRSVFGNEPNAQLLPLTDPVVVEQDDYTLLWILGALLAMGLGGLVTWLVLRWWRERERPELEVVPPPPWEIALAELRALEDRRSRMVQDGLTEAWVDAVSDTVRNYLGRRFGFQGLESTTDEIADRLGRSSELSIEPDDAVGFLGQCDLVKFARASLAEEASTELLQDAFLLVRRTRPSAAEGGPP